MPERAPQLGVPQEGELIADKYRVERELATGGMGVILLAVDEVEKRRVAVKVMLPEAMEVDGAVTRFQREAQAAAGIKSEHVVQISDVGTLPTGAPFMVMEYLEGEDLSHVVGPGKTLAVQEAVDYVLQACAAMAEAHKAGIVHRDLKPSNLFRTRDAKGAPNIKVLDFGISKFTSGSEVLGKDGASLTATRAMMGSPLYMSPEQVRSAKNVDRRTDIWSLGVILYELVTGRLPFEADTAGGICAMIVADEPVPLRWMNKELPEELEQVVMRCLAKEPAMRFQDVAELAMALRPFAGATGDLAAENASRSMEHASGILPTLHAAPIKLDLSARAASAPLTKTSVATPTGKKDEAVARSEPPPTAARKSSAGGRTVALAILFAGVGYGAWHFRTRLASEAKDRFAHADPTPTSSAGDLVGPTGGDAEATAATLPIDASLLMIDFVDAGPDAAPDAVAPSDAAADLDAEADDAGEDEEEEEDDAAVAATPLPHATAHPARPKPRLPVKKKKKKTTRTR